MFTDGALQHKTHGAAATAGTAPSQRHPRQKANNKYKSHAPQRATVQQLPAATATDVTAPAATGSSQLAEVPGAVATVPVGIAPTQAVLAAPRQASGRRRKQGHPCARLLRTKLHLALGLCCIQLQMLI